MNLKQVESDLLGKLWLDRDLSNHLTYLCDVCNGRFAGTQDERRAGEYIMSRFRTYGLTNVSAEPFDMPGWERGATRLSLMLGENTLELPCLALPGTQACDLEAEVIDVGQGKAADFQRVNTIVPGKIVLTSSDGPSRGEKYQAALEAGAAAFIFGNSQPGMLTPTGSIDKELPAIGLSYENAARIRRMLRNGTVKASLSIEARTQPVRAYNILGEIPGSNTEEGWILAGGHYDGHDIAQGAQDNAAGTAVLMEAARLLSPLRDDLKLGIRFVLFSGEELGLYGSYAYASEHAVQHDETRLVFNVDVVGMAMPLVLRTQASPELADYLRQLPLEELDLLLNDDPKAFIMNSDHFPFSLAGIPSVWAVTSHPVSVTGWGHTAADTLDKVEPRTLRETAAAVVRLLLRMACDPENLPRGRKSPAEVQQMVREAGFEKALRASGRWPFS